MGKDKKSGKVLQFSSDSSRLTARIADRQEAAREAKTQDLRKRFSAARKSTESPARAAQRLKKIFRIPGRNPDKS